MDTIVPPLTTAMGALINYITHSLNLPFQPMNINFGLFPPLPIKSKGMAKRLLFAQRALEDMKEWEKEIEG
jgi:methylenetetrahydrofolate--tRNA-(uracil-5-)-methyltransferase